MNIYLENLEKLEFVVTTACSGNCRHCSDGDHARNGLMLDPSKAAETVRKLAANYNLKTVMTFGGEPLLNPKCVFAVMKAAKEMNVPKRQLITNGFFSKDISTIKNMAIKLKSSGVNDLLLSVDAFHQETIPLEIVKAFALELKAQEVPIRLQPAWLVSRNDDNEYNLKTRELINSFRDLEIYENDGNVIFPEGNAKKYLSEFFLAETPKNPYIEDPKNIKCVSVSADGTVLGEDLYKRDIIDILNQYTPK